MRICAEESDARAAVAGAIRHRATVCILDDMLGSTVAATADLVARRPGIKVIALVSDLRPQDLRALVRAGVAGYLPRAMDMERLPDIVGSVLQGGAAIPRHLTSFLVADFRDTAPRRRRVEAEHGSSLTGREWQIFDLLQQQQSTREIARRLYISDVTVRTHVASLLKKLELPNRAALCSFEKRSDRLRARGRTIAQAS